MTDKSKNVSQPKDYKLIVEKDVKLTMRDGTIAWGSATKMPWRDAAGNIHNILGLIDHGSRVALALHPMADKRAITLVRALCDAVDAFGMPRILRTDNEVVWKSWLFQLSLSLLGIRHQFTKLHCPWQNGRVERLFGTLKDKLDRLDRPGLRGLESGDD